MTPERWQQIEALYHAARVRPANERAAYLADVCSSDEELRREVEHLLSQPGSEEGFLAGPVAAMAAGLTDAPPIMVGRTLGGYQLQKLIGVGGMGEVYRARDVKLGRAVAIKVLPHAFTSDPARLARLEREARTLAALNHPNICAIHGFEEAASVRFLILELVDGDTLADRLNSPRRPSDAGLTERDALTIARQIARALDFAHERGIVHRDLKPANVKIGADGSVKVLDFGLAKAAAGDGADLQALPTITADGTIDGAIIGTPAYMSPEQARGKTVDKRTDIWSFGCVLYEMLTGRAVFAGDTLADTIAKVIEREPDWTALPPSTPEPIRNLLLGCLAKDPRERLRDIGDVRITIDSILSGSSGTRAAVPVRRPARPRAAWLPWALVGALGLGLVLVLVLTWSSTSALPPVAQGRWPFELPPGQSLDGSGGAHVLTLSRDGTLLAYVARPRLLYIWPVAVGVPEAKPVPGTEKSKGVREVRFSPDGKDIAFYSFADQQLKQMPVDGGPARTICAADTPTGLDWGPDGTVLFGQGRQGIWRASVNTTTKEQVAKLETGEEAHGPFFLPDGDHFLYSIAKDSRRDRWDRADIVVQSLRTGDRETLNVHGSDPRYVAPGYLVYAVGPNIYGVRFDAASRKVSGAGTLVVERVSRAAGSFTGSANFSVAENGTLAFEPGSTDGAPVKMDMALIDPNGKEPPVRLNAPSEQYDAMRVSPDESTVAYGIEDDKEWTIYKLAIDGSTVHRVTAPGSHNRYPTWTRDSKRIAFQSTRGKDSGIWMQPVTGNEEPLRLTTAAEGEIHVPESWSPDDTLLYSVTKNEMVSLWTIPVPRGRPSEPKPFGRVKSTDPMSGVFSRDGKVVAYTMTDKGNTTICVEAFPSPYTNDCLPQKLADSPKHPQWSADDKGLYFDPRVGDFEWVDVERRGVPKLGTPQMVKNYSFRLAPPRYRTPYDVTRSGRFLGLITPGTDGYERRPSSRSIIFIPQWVETLKGKVK